MIVKDKYIYKIAKLSQKDKFISYNDLAKTLNKRNNINQQIDYLIDKRLICELIPTFDIQKYKEYREFEKRKYMITQICEEYLYDLDCKRRIRCVAYVLSILIAFFGFLMTLIFGI